MRQYLNDISMLYVEDDELVRSAYKRTLSRLSKKLFVAKDGVEGIELYKKYKPDIIISDIRMPRKNGIEMAREIREINPEQVILFTTAHTESGYTLEALNMQVDGYLTKPVDKNVLKQKLSLLAKGIVLEKENKKKSKVLQTILNSQTNIIVLTNFIDIEFASVSFYKLFGVKDKKGYMTKFHNIFSILSEQNSYIYGKNRDEFLESYYKVDEGSKIISFDTIDGVKSFYIHIEPVELDDEDDDLNIVSLTNITRLQNERVNAIHKATHDKLTGAYNREKFNEILRVELEEAKRYKKDLSMAILDIDHFKLINDTYGHLVGDKVLQELANFCKNHIRKTDTFARWGGEEFTMLMNDIDISTAKAICEKLRIDIENLKIDNLPKITVSFGVTQMKESDTEEEFFKRADKALYIAKKSGRNKVVVAT